MPPRETDLSTLPRSPSRGLSKGEVLSFFCFFVLVGFVASLVIFSQSLLLFLLLLLRDPFQERFSGTNFWFWMFVVGPSSSCYLCFWFTSVVCLL